MVDLTFDEENHIYYADGQKVLSVTQALSAVGKWPTFSEIPESDREFYMSRGQKVHKAIYYIIRFIQELESKNYPPEAVNGIISDYIQGLDPLIKNYVISFDLFRLNPTIGLHIVSTEERLYSEELNVAGTLDLYACMRFKIVVGAFLGDFKCGVHYYQYGYQTAGYHILKFGQPYLTGGMQMLRRFGIHLNRDGKMPKLIEHDNIADFLIFEQAIRQANKSYSIQ